MKNVTKIPVKIMEKEITIKLFEYLKRNYTIDDGMYNFCVNKIMNKLTLEKSKIDDNYINNIDNYKILTIV